MMSVAHSKLTATTTAPNSSHLTTKRLSAAFLPKRFIALLLLHLYYPTRNSNLILPTNASKVQVVDPAGQGRCLRPCSRHTAATKGCDVRDLQQDLHWRLQVRENRKHMKRKLTNSHDRVVRERLILTSKIDPDLFECAL